MRILVTGGCGFIGSNFIHFLLEHYQPLLVTNVDALTYAGNQENVAGLDRRYSGRYEFFQADIVNAEAMRTVLARHKFFAVVNFAAETHADHSILSPHNSVHSNVMGVNTLLELAREFHIKRFLQVSTDEVYGNQPGHNPLPEGSPLQPDSPYAASKASADMVALAAAKTYGQEVMVTRSASNYGPRQHPEKFVPRVILSALQDQAIQLHGDHQRGWLQVEDHCRALQAILLDGTPGEVYHIPGGPEWSDLDLAKFILRQLGKPESLLQSSPGSGGRVRVDGSKLTSLLDWQPIHSLEAGLTETVDWYQNNRAWWESRLASQVR